MPIVRLDKIAGVHLTNGRHVTDDLRNGYFVQLNGLVAGEKDLYNISSPTALGNELLLHSTPEVMYDPRLNGLKHFEVEAGQEARLYHLEEGDVITLTEDAFATGVAVGDVVSGTVGDYRLTAPAGAGARFTAEVIEATILGYDNTPAYAIRVLTV